MEMESTDDVKIYKQLCEAMYFYEHLRASEGKKRPAVAFMETVQEDITPSIRAILIDWLVEVAEDYRLLPETLYLTINYVDRYLSGNPIHLYKIQLLGVACMMIASKYEEICAPNVEEFCNLTENIYSNDEVLQMESSVLNFLNFEMTAPTVTCFLNLFLVSDAQMDIYNMGIHPMRLEFLASYISDLSLLRYSMLRYAPSLIAASAIFLARFLLMPSLKPWNLILRYYTLYQPSDLQKCVKTLHSLVCKCPNFELKAIREKYSQHKYKYVANITCPASIPLENFDNIRSPLDRQMDPASS
uniref:cyclin-A1-3-like n=1 Tax=Erigeron canadensis TaxID=72917 RepID=UPI001CB9CEC2|nr:cyclin-A1-3-like [Erigeron canadensis]